MGRVQETWEIKLNGVRYDRGFDWSLNSKELGATKRIRLSIMSEGEVYVALAETKEKQPRRINCVYGGWGNRYNNVKLIEKNSNTYQWGSEYD